MTSSETIQLILAIVALLCIWGLLIWCTFGQSKICKEYRRSTGSESAILLRTGFWIVVVGVLAAVIVGINIRRTVDAERDEVNSILEKTSEDWMKTDLIKFSHYLKISSDENYIKTNSYNKVEKQISDHDAEMKANLRQIAKRKSEAEARFDKQLYLAYVIVLIITTMTFGLGGSFISRGLSERLRELLASESEPLV